MNQLISLRIIKSSIALIGLFSTITFSQDTQILTSPINGTIWNGLVEIEKKAEAANDHEDAFMVKSIREYYVRGFYAGFYYFDPEYLSTKLYTKATVAQIVRGIDNFYQDYRNEQLDLLQALLIVSMELRGEDKTKIEERVRSMRKSRTN